MRTMSVLFALCFAWTSTSTLHASLPDDEMLNIKDAIEVNIPDKNLRPYFTKLLIAIRKAENGGPGRQFGVMSPKARTYRQQAGWCASICWKRYAEWKEMESSGRTPYLVYLASRYAPRNAENDPLRLNHNWLRNVKSHMNGDENP